MAIKKTEPGRNANLDALKGLAVLFMIFQHLTFWLWKSSELNFRDTFIQHPLIMTLNATGGISAALFILLSGVGYGFFSSSGGASSTAVKRGMFLIICGYIVNILTPSWFSGGSWYVLHCIGFMIIVSPVISRGSNRLLLISAAAVIMAAPAGQYLLSTPEMIANIRMGNYSMPGGVFRLILFEGHFPVFPWAAFFLTGVLLQRMFAAHSQSSAAITGAGFIAAGIVFSVIGQVPSVMANGLMHKIFLLKKSFYPAQPPLLLILLGIAVLLSAAAFTLPALAERNPLVLLGRVSLTVFTAHVIIFREGSISLNYFQKLSETQALAVMISFAVFSLSLSYLWERKNFAGSLEWIMRKIT